MGRKAISARLVLLQELPHEDSDDAQLGRKANIQSGSSKAKFESEISIILPCKKNNRYPFGYFRFHFKASTDELNLIRTLLPPTDKTTGF